MDSKQLHQRNHANPWRSRWPRPFLLPGTEFGREKCIIRHFKSSGMFFYLQNTIALKVNYYSIYPKRNYVHRYLDACTIAWLQRNRQCDGLSRTWCGPRHSRELCHPTELLPHGPRNTASIINLSSNVFMLSQSTYLKRISTMQHSTWLETEG